MNIIDINYNKLNKSINDYMLDNNENIFMSQDTYIHVNKPIVLMSDKTLNLFKEKERNEKYTYYNKEEAGVIPMIFGCYIAIANWLPLGEVELK